MPIPWIPALPSGEYRIRSVQEEIVILSKSQKDDLEKGETVFSDGVIVIYGPTKITADRLVVRRRPEDSNATASGSVKIDDPDFKFQTENLFLQWKPGAREASAENLNGEIAGATLSAKTMAFKEGIWTFEQVRGSTCPEDRPHYEIRSGKVQIVPGQHGKIWYPSFYAFGTKLVQLPTQTFNLDRTIDGIGFPRLTANADGQLGVSWGGNMLIDRRTLAGFSIGTRQGSYPAGSFALTRTFLDRNQSEAKIKMRDDLGERFDGGWFDSVDVLSTNNDFKRLGQKRSTASLSTTINRGSTNWPGDIRYSKPIELAYEHSDTVGKLAVFGDVRYQAMSAQGEPTISRVSAYTAIATDEIRITQKVGGYARFDAAVYAGNKQFGWGRGMAGLVYHAAPWLDLGAVGVVASEFGEPTFEADRLYATTGAHFRADIKLGPTKASYLYKYDVGRKWYDREWSVSQVAGCVEVYLQSREYPQSYRYGVKLRVDQFVDLIQSRRFERPANRKTAISTPEAP